MSNKEVRFTDLGYQSGDMNIAGVKTFTELGERMEAALKPWTLDLEYVENTNHVIYFVMHGESTAATCRHKEEAEFITRACNSHDDLLAALIGIGEAMRDWDGHSTGPLLRAAVAANAAIRKAKGQS